MKTIYIHNLPLLYVPSFSICIKKICVQQAEACQYKELDFSLVASWKKHPNQTYHSVRQSRSSSTKKRLLVGGQKCFVFIPTLSPCLINTNTKNSKLVVFQTVPSFFLNKNIEYIINV